MPARDSGARRGVSGPARPARDDASFLTDEGQRLFAQGRHLRLYETLGARPTTVDGARGVRFAVWAPNAEAVYVIGDFNGWRNDGHPLRRGGDRGVWEGFVADVGPGALYKYHVVSRDGARDKADPFAFRCETPPATASVVWDLDYEWGDGDWMADRSRVSAADAPVSIYEMHFGSWLPARGGGAPPSYREVAPGLADHLLGLGFTHVELMPVMEHPHYESWGYQITGFFAPTSRYGTPQDLMYLIDHLHQRGIAVILDWVPFHFPADDHGLADFDGTPLYERGELQPRWTTHVFDHSRPQVASFLLSSALFWLHRYHVDALRVDAVSSMVYPDYPGHGDIPPAEAKERLPRSEAGIAFLRRLNDEVHAAYPGVATIAEDSLSMPDVTAPTSEGGLGFDLKWGIGWIHDTLDAYMTAEPARRPERHGTLTFPLRDLFTERFVLSLSHDEIQPGMGTLLGKMPGEEAQRFANVRLFLAYLFAYPGKKLLFMGSEFAQPDEWRVNEPVQWALVDQPPHDGVRRVLTDLNRIYRDEPALHENDFDESGFTSLSTEDADGGTFSFLRRDRSGGEMLVACNFSADAHEPYRIGVPAVGPWREVLNTDARDYGGAGLGNAGPLSAEPSPADNQPFSLTLTLPPLAAVYLKAEKNAP